jgi:hypothetical protein
MGREPKAAAAPGSMTAFPQAEQKRASPGSDAPHPEQYKAMGRLQKAIVMN